MEKLYDITETDDEPFLTISVKKTASQTHVLQGAAQ